MENDVAQTNCKGGLVGWLDRSFYAGVKDSWDDHAFRDYILRHLKPEHILLDLGAGAGIVKQMNFRGLAAKVCGYDPDPRVMENPYLDEAKIGIGENIDWPDSTFDIVIADNVLEHIASPEIVFGQIFRVLKPGGRFFFKTPNRYHYVPLISRLTPHSFHGFYNWLRGRATEDTFETYYRANRPADVAAAAKRVGLQPVNFELNESRPEYLRINGLMYLCGIVYERAVNSTDLLKDFRVSLIGDLTRVK